MTTYIYDKKTDRVIEKLEKSVKVVALDPQYSQMAYELLEADIERVKRNIAKAFWYGI